MPEIIAFLTAALTIETAAEKAAGWYNWYYGKQACDGCTKHRCVCHRHVTNKMELGEAKEEDQPH